MTLHEATYGSAAGSPAIRIDCVMPDSADVTHHPFQAEIDDFVDAILTGRETMLNVFDAQKTMEVCLAADQSATAGGRPGRPPADSLSRTHAAGSAGRRRHGGTPPPAPALPVSGFASVCRFSGHEGASGLVGPARTWVN